MGVSSRKLKEKDMRRQEIIDAAEKVFFSKGFDTATMDDVAKEAEFSKRTVYVYFRSKDELYFEIMTRGYILLNSKLEEALKGCDLKTGLERIGFIGSHIIEFSEEYPNYFNSIMEYENKDQDFELNKESQDENSASECYAQGEILLSHLITSLEVGIKDGSIREDIDVNNTAVFLWGSSLGILRTYSTKEKYLKFYHKIEKKSFFEESISLLLRAIKK
ncbi:MAG: TetR/AcrR family transcriptional regulator [Proteocatella sp.]